MYIKQSVINSMHTYIVAGLLPPIYIELLPFPRNRQTSDHSPMTSGQWAWRSGSEPPRTLANQTHIESERHRSLKKVQLLTLIWLTTCAGDSSNVIADRIVIFAVVSKVLKSSEGWGNRFKEIDIYILCCLTFLDRLLVQGRPVF